MSRRNDIKDMVAKAGLAVVEIASQRCHFKVTVARPDGFAAMFVFAVTTSDNKRADKNNFARLKRFACGKLNPITDRSCKK